MTAGPYIYIWSIYIHIYPSTYIWSIYGPCIHMLVHIPRLGVHVVADGLAQAVLAEAPRAVLVAARQHPARPHLPPRPPPPGSARFTAAAAAARRDSRRGRAALRHRETANRGRLGVLADTSYYPRNRARACACACACRRAPRRAGRYSTSCTKSRVCDRACVCRRVS